MSSSGLQQADIDDRQLERVNSDNGLSTGLRCRLVLGLQMSYGSRKLKIEAQLNRCKPDPNIIWEKDPEEKTSYLVIRQFYFRFVY